jgi:hypothetical protein
MKTPPNHSRLGQTPRRGFTLVELSTAIGIALTIAAIMMTLLQQQVSFHKIMRAQNFLVEEAPQINNSVTSILNRADAFRIHSNLSEAVADVNAVTSDGNALVVGFLNPDGSREFGILSFEDNSGDPFLGYYAVDPTVPFTSAGSPNWIVSRQVSDADFFLENGVFRLRLTGPAGETITYTATPRL